MKPRVLAAGAVSLGPRRRAARTHAMGQEPSREWSGKASCRAAHGAVHSAEADRRRKATALAGLPGEMEIRGRSVLWRRRSRRPAGRSAPHRARAPGVRLTTNQTLERPRASRPRALASSGSGRQPETAGIAGRPGRRRNRSRQERRPQPPHHVYMTTIAYTLSVTAHRIAAWFADLQEQHLTGRCRRLAVAPVITRPGRNEPARSLALKDQIPISGRRQ